MPKKPRDVVEQIKKDGIKMVDFKFVDVPGTWQHNTVPADQIDEDAIVQGIGFDGSSIRGFQAINESDMILKPDCETAVVDPFLTVPTLSMICDVFDPIAKALYAKDPRNIAKRAEDYLTSSGIGDTAYFGPEAEFFILDNVVYENSGHCAGYELDSIEGHWNSNKPDNPNPGYTIRPKEGYYPVSPSDTYTDLRSEMVLAMQEFGMTVEMQHHEVGTAGQAEIDLRFDTLRKMADNLMAYKYAVKNVAKRNGKVVTFMPKPLFGDNGSGMHCPPVDLEGRAAALLRRQRLRRSVADDALLHRRSADAHRRAARVLRADDQLVQTAGPALRGAGQRGVLGAQPLGCGSHPDLQPGRRQGQAARVPPAPIRRATRTWRSPRMLMAGLDGIENKIDPIKAGFGPLDTNIYELEPEEAAKVKTVPGSLRESLRGARGRPRLPDQGRRLYRGLHPRVDRLQDRA